MPRVFAMRNLRGIIALDLDDTLLNSKKELSDRNLSALKDADAAGYVVVPATGRFLTECRPLFGICLCSDMP